MTEKETEDNMLYQMIDEQCFVDLSEEMKHPEVAISYGQHTYQTRNGPITYDTPLITYGNIAIVQAQPKQGKSFFMSLISSVFLSKDGKNKYGGKLRGHSRGGCVIHIDTEQSVFHAQRMFRRSFAMNKDTEMIDCYHTYALRQENFQTKKKVYSLEVTAVTR